MYFRMDYRDPDFLLTYFLESIRHQPMSPIRDPEVLLAYVNFMETEWDHPNFVPNYTKFIKAAKEAWLKPN